MFFVRIVGMAVVPLIASWCAWKYAHRAGWRKICIALAVLAVGMALVEAGTFLLILRPLAGFAGYDRAVAAISAEFGSSCNMPEERRSLLRSLRPRLNQAERDAGLLADLVQDCDRLSADFNGEIDRACGLETFVREAFRRESVSDRRAQWYVDQMIPATLAAELIRSDREILGRVDLIRQEAKRRVAPSPSP